MNCNLRYDFEHFFVFGDFCHWGKHGEEKVCNEYPVLQGIGFQGINATM